jgi:hypothetical protein
MDMKKSIILFLAALVVAFSCLAAQAGAAGSGLTMVVMPARYSVMQVGFDLFNRFSTVLVSYQGDATTETPLIHAWNGAEWVKVSLEDYSSAAFLQMTPSQAILVGDDQLLPPVMASAAAWCPRVERIQALDTAEMVNSLAKLMSFKSTDWKWFARRYNLDLEDHNAARRTSSWYDRPSYEDEWTAKLRRGKSAPVQPVEEMPVVEEPAEAPVEPVIEPVVESVVEPMVEVTPIEAAPAQPWEEKAVEVEAPVK